MNHKTIAVRSGSGFRSAERLCLLHTIKDAKDAFSQGAKLVFTRVNTNLGDPLDVGTQAVYEPLGMGHAAGKQNRIHLALKDSGHGSGFLGDLIDHCGVDGSRLSVAGVDAALHFLEIAGSQVGKDAALSEDHAVELLFVELAREALPDEV